MTLTHDDDADHVAEIGSRLRRTMASFIAIFLFVLLNGCLRNSETQAPEERLIYVINHLDNPITIVISQSLLTVPARSTGMVRLDEVLSLESEAATVDVVAESATPPLAGSLLMQISKSEHLELYVGGYRPPTDTEKLNAASLDCHEIPADWFDLFEELKQLSETKPPFLGTNYPVLRTMKNSVGMILIQVPPGQFIMGAPTTEPGFNATERQHDVILTRAYWLGQTEVTQGQWLKVMGTASTQGARGENLPIHSITWFEAVEFCKRLSEIEGRQYRLPTEAEWEYACRAGTTTAYSFGVFSHASMHEHAWYYENALGRPQPVATKLPNRWGFHDMLGNISEWCADWFSLRYPQGMQIDPAGPANPPVGYGYDDDGERVVRGGDYLFTSSHRSAARNALTPLTRHATCGFRVVLDAGIDP